MYSLHPRVDDGRGSTVITVGIDVSTTVVVVVVVVD